MVGSCTWTFPKNRGFADGVEGVHGVEDGGHGGRVVGVTP